VLHVDPREVEAAALSSVSTAGVRIMVTHVPICTSPRSARTR